MSADGSAALSVEAIAEPSADEKTQQASREKTGHGDDTLEQSTSEQPMSVDASAAPAAGTIAEPTADEKTQQTGCEKTGHGDDTLEQNTSEHPMSVDASAAPSAEAIAEPSADEKTQQAGCEKTGDNTLELSASEQPHRGRPKKVVGGAFGRFLAEKRGEISQDTKKMSEVVKIASQRFKDLSDAEKAEWQTKYVQEVAKYAEDMKAWLEAGGEEADKKPKDKAQKRPKAKLAGKADKGSSPKRKADDVKTTPAKQGGSRKREAGKAETTPAKLPRASGELDSSKKASAAQGRSRGKAPAAAAAVLLEKDIAEKAEKAGITSVLQKLLVHEDVVASGKSQAEAFRALEKAGGLIHPARRALLGA